MGEGEGDDCDGIVVDGTICACNFPSTVRRAAEGSRSRGVLVAIDRLVVIFSCPAAVDGAGGSGVASVGVCCCCCCFPPLVARLRMFSHFARRSE